MHRMAERNIVMRKNYALDLPQIRQLGRTVSAQNRKSIIFDWTDSGFEFEFDGSLLLAEIITSPYIWSESIINDVTQQSETIKQTDWPWVIVLLDEDEKPYRKFQLNAEKEEYLLFSSNAPEHHRIRLIRLNEAAFYRTELQILRYDGTISRSTHSYNGRIEFIGDSITCGFGIATNNYNRLFYGIDEDGWETYASLTARKLNYEPQMVCVSGITLSSGFQWMPYVFGMKEIYPYADWFNSFSSSKQRWDFSSHHADIVVVNLGTNDATGIAKSDNPEEAEQKFAREYRDFLSCLREKYGSETIIICALGTMDYYLFDHIKSISDELRADGDQRIYSFKFQKMMPDSSDVGALGHPTYIRHKKMSEELCRFIQQIEHQLT